MPGEQGTLPFEDQNHQEPLSSLNLQRPLVFFDLETTGLDVNQDRIVQFAFLRVNPDLSRDEFQALVNPGSPIPVEATRVHGITDGMVESEPSFDHFAPQIQTFLQNTDLSGFNIARFDVPFLQAEMQRHGFELDFENMKIIDAQVIFHRKEPRDLSAAFRFYCDGQHEEAHDAMGDVRVTLEILDAQIKRYHDLPKDISSLDKFCNPRDDRFVTLDRKFYWRNGQAIIGFGKHKGTSLQDLALNERDYLLWMQNGDFTKETKTIITNALQGVFPEKRDSDDE